MSHQDLSTGDTVLSTYEKVLALVSSHPEMEKTEKKKRVVTNEIRRSRQIVTRARKKMNRVMFIMTEMHYGPVGPDITVPSCF